MGKKVTCFLAGILFWFQAAAANSGADVVRQYVAAYNDGDVDAMLDHATADIRWMSVSGDQVSVETSNRIGLRAGMTAYFNSTPDARSELRSIVESGPFVHTVEEAFWSTADGEKSQCSMAVYELADRKIQNVWYFAAYPCP